MLKEYQLVESRLDHSHTYQEADNGYCCRVCRRPRALHALQNFSPTQAPSRLGIDPKAAYRGPHPYWSRPGSYSKVERGELSAEAKAERQRIERAIQKDKEQFQQRQAAHR